MIPIKDIKIEMTYYDKVMEEYYEYKMRDYQRHIKRLREEISHHGADPRDVCDLQQNINKLLYNIEHIRDPLKLDENSVCNEEHQRIINEMYHDMGDNIQHAMCNVFGLLTHADNVRYVYQLHGKTPPDWYCEKYQHLFH